MLRYYLFSLQTLAVVFFTALYSASLFAQGTGPDGQVEKLQSGQMPYFDAVPDPIERFNRCSWAVNDWLFRGVIYPLSFVYNSVTPKPLRTGSATPGIT